MKTTPTIDNDRFALAGKATFTLESKKTGKHYTFRVTKKEEGFFFVSALQGPNNEADYGYLGYVNGRGFGTSKKSPKDSTALKVFRWAFSQKFNHPDMEFYHAGKCCRCGRKLTTPESVSLGIGPVCAGLV